MSNYGEMPAPPPSGPEYGAGYGQGYGAPGYGRGPRPAAVENAVRLMFVVAAISVISTIVSLATRGDLKKRIENANPGYSASRVDSLVDTTFAFALVIGIVFLILYIALAFQVRSGRNWARIVTWVLAGLGVLGALGTLASTETPLSRVLTLIDGVIDIAIIVLLAQGASNRYFKPPLW